MKKYSSTLETIAYLTQRNTLNVSENQVNRYCVVLNTRDGKEAFYFSTPIYNSLSRKLVGRKFIALNGFYQMTGSCCTIQVTNTNIQFQKDNKTVSLEFCKNIVWKLSDGYLMSDDVNIIPSYNGVVIEGNIRKMLFNIKMNFKHNGIRSSHSCVCFMESKFKPIFVVSSLKAQRKTNNCSPLLVKFNKQSEAMGNFVFYSSDPIATHGSIEMNFYEPKIIQDTPVSQKHPKENNAFGAIGFIGKSDFYGTQWLYSRLDTNKMPELQNKLIRNIKLYIPRFNQSSVQLTAVDLPNRFCSFGSNWSNKLQAGNKKRDVIARDEYVCIDITDLYTSRGRLHESAGMVITPINRAECEYEPISTGDSYCAPPIICVKYTNL